jgi:hypothetical protein
MTSEQPIIGTRELPVTVFVSIGNVDDVLVARDWARFHAAVAEMLELGGAAFQGAWFSSPLAPWQTAVWCVDVKPGVIDRLKGQLAQIGASFGRGMIGWNEVSTSVLLG